MSIRAYRRAVKCSTTGSRESDSVNGSTSGNGPRGRDFAMSRWDGTTESAGTTAAEVSQACGTPWHMDNKLELFFTLSQDRPRKAQLWRYCGARRESVLRPSSLFPGLRVDALLVDGQCTPNLGTRKAVVCGGDELTGKCRHVERRSNGGCGPESVHLMSTSDSPGDENGAPLVDLKGTVTGVSSISSTRSTNLTQQSVFSLAP